MLETGMHEQHFHLTYVLQAERTRRKVTRMVVALVVAFFVCWLPFHVLHMLQIPGIKVRRNICRRMSDFTFCLGFANRFVKVFFLVATV